MSVTKAIGPRFYYGRAKVTIYALGIVLERIFLSFSISIWVLF